nr:hypothetical protein [uncultured Oscillibacter sp.]
MIQPGKKHFEPLPVKRTGKKYKVFYTARDACRAVATEDLGLVANAGGFLLLCLIVGILPSLRRPALLLSSVLGLKQNGHHKTRIFWGFLCFRSIITQTSLDNGKHTIE